MLTFIRKSLRWKLIAAMTTLILLVIALIGLISYYESSLTIRSQIEQFSNQIIDQANLNVNSNVTDYQYGFSQMGTSPEFQKWLQVDQGDIFETHLEYKEMEKKYIGPFVSQHPEIVSISFYNSNGNEIHFRNSPYLLNLNYTIKDETWFNSLQFSNQIDLFVSESKHYFSGAQAVEVLPVMIMVKRFRYYNKEGILKMDISLDPIHGILDKIRLSQKSVAVISDSHGVIIASPQEKDRMQKLDPGIVERLQASQTGSFLNKKTNEMFVFQTLPNTGWKLSIQVPYRNIASGIYLMRNVTGMIAILSVVITSLLIWFITSSFTKGLHSLRMTILQTLRGNFQTQVSVKGIDEVADIGRVYNKMLDDLNHSVEQLAESKAQQKEAVQSALQSQIQSHFLYNALESINSMASLINHEPIERTAIALSKMLRYTSNYRESVVTLREELGHLQDYLYIIGVLHRDDITYTLEVEPDALHAQCLKAILQPFVENCVKHGFEATGEPLFIRISAKIVDGYARILIADNGRGFPLDKLNELEHRISDMEQSEVQYRKLSSIGVLNVYYRLKMYYQPKTTGLKIANGSDGGARVDLYFPSEGLSSRKEGVL